MRLRLWTGAVAMVLLVGCGEGLGSDLPTYDRDGSYVSSRKPGLEKKLCRFVDCGSHGWCVVDAGMPQCECESGFVADGLSCVRVGPACGDGTCDPAEDCTSCEADCGSCPAACGDGFCGGDEDCSACPEDCGACAAECSLLATANWELCDQSATTCEAVFHDGAGCQALCAAAGLACLAVYEDLDGFCARNDSKPTLSCDTPTGHRSDYCVCGGPQACIPDCSLRTCGDNGCGGSCGTCTGTDQCQDGACVGSGPLCGDGACAGTEDAASCPVDCAGTRRCGPQGDRLCVFPGAQGFGTDTIAGRGGRIIEVTNLNDSGAGSLRAALSASGPRVVVFTVSGTIRLFSVLKINEPFVTVAGQTAPSPGINLRGATLLVSTHDVLVQHLRVRVGEDLDGSSAGSRDGIRVSGTPDVTYNVVLDHLSVSWAIDEQFSVVYGAKDITLSNTFITEALNDSIHPDGTHSKAVLIRERTHNLSIIGNLVAHNKDRNPRLAADSWVVSVNNLWYNAGRNRFFDVDLGTHGGNAPHKLTVEGNVFINGVNTPTPVWPIWVDATTLVGTQVYEHDNLAPGSTTMLRNDTSYQPEVGSRPIWTPSIQPMPASRTEAAVLARAGARPGDRDAVDTRVVADVVARRGRIIDNTAQVGGWPNLAKNTRAFAAPANPGADDDGDGYTNLEELLHQLAAAVEAP